MVAIVKCAQVHHYSGKIDPRNQLSLESFRTLENYPKAIEESLHIYHQKKWLEGFDAVMEVSKKLPLMG